MILGPEGLVVVVAAILAASPLIRRVEPVSGPNHRGPAAPALPVVALVWDANPPTLELFDPAAGRTMKVSEVSSNPQTVRRPSAGEILAADLGVVRRLDGTFAEEPRLLVFDGPDLTIKRVAGSCPFCYQLFSQTNVRLNESLSGFPV